MKKRKDLPVGMGPKTEAMIEELEFHFRTNAHELIRRLIKELGDPEIKKQFAEYVQQHKKRKVEKSIRIRGFKFLEEEIDHFSGLQWECRIKGLSTFIKHLVYFNYERFIEKIP